ncbi:MAG: T9SS type A sorting domain-containing protein [Flavobacteriaceae bacterium]|nr:T9SS type A sorting domain-containing protein [Flavobacteriaceae bacterium]
MKAKTILLLCLLFTITISSQNWKGYDINSKAGIIATMVVGNLNDTIYVSGNDAGKQHGKNSFVYSKDKGVTWSTSQGILKEHNGYVAHYEGVKDRVYASVKLPSSDYLYYYSKDNGTTWKLDTIGLPHYYGIKTAQKDAFNIKKLGNEYVVAYNSLAVNGAYFKKVTDTKWMPLAFPANSNKINFSFTAIGTTWFALYGSFGASDNGFSIAKSTDNGKNWEVLTKTGLPSTMIPSKLTSNGTDKLFLGAAISGTTNKTAVYYSDDNGATWKSTNAETLVPYTHGKAIINLFATNNQVIVSYSSAYNVPPVYLYSNTETPNFVMGDASGLTNFPFAFPNVFFNIGETIYLNHYNDLHASNNTTLNVKTFTEDTAILVYPNPIKEQLQLKSTKDFSWKITSILGKTVLSGNYQSKQSTTKIDISTISKGVYLFSTDKGFSKKIIKD